MKVILKYKGYLLAVIFVFAAVLLIKTYSDYFSSDNINTGESHLISRRSHTLSQPVIIADSDTSLSTPFSDSPDDSAKADFDAVISDLYTENSKIINDYLADGSCDSEETFIEESCIEESSIEESSIEEELSVEETQPETTEKNTEETITRSFRVKSDVTILNMRSAPDSDASIVVRLTNIGHGTVLDYDENWAHVKTKNYEGYVATRFINITE